MKPKWGIVRRVDMGSSRNPTLLFIAALVFTCGLAVAKAYGV